MPVHLSDQPGLRARFFSRQGPLHAAFGGGRVADVLLWRNRNLSAAILLGSTVIWFLFEVIEYHLLTLMCHLFITTMLVIFIWSNLAALLNWNPPKVPEIILSESAFREVALTFHKKLNWFLSTIYDIAHGKELALFLLVIFSLWVLSTIGTHFDTLNLLYIGLLCILTLPALYERYEYEVDSLARRWKKDMENWYNKLDSQFLNKIPRGPVKDKKLR